MENEELIVKIKAEIERRITDNTFGAKLELIDILAWLDTLESEKPINPEAAMKELNEKIAIVKQRGTWDGVDVDKYMDKVRGGEPENPMELEGEIKRFVAEYGYERSEDILLIAIVARQFYELGCRRAAEKYDEIEYNRQRAEENTPNDLEEAAWDCVLDSVDVNNPVLLPKYKVLLTSLFIDGAKWQAEKCDEETYKLLYAERQTAYINGWHDCKEQMMNEAVEVCTVVEEGRYCQEIGPLFLDERAGFKPGDKVRIIIVKED